MRQQHKSLAELNAFVKRVNWGDKTLYDCSRRELLDCIYYMTEALTRANAIVDQAEKRKQNSVPARIQRFFGKFRLIMFKDGKNAEKKAIEPGPQSEPVADNHSPEYTPANPG